MVSTRLIVPINLADVPDEGCSLADSPDGVGLGAEDGVEHARAAGCGYDASNG